jgi:uncharacterized protein YndB with AHSA1/START domain
MTDTIPDVITRSTTFARPIESVWTALTHPDYLTRWMCTTIGPFDLIPGNVMHMTWQDGQSNRCVIDTVEPPNRFGWRWIPALYEEADRPLEEQGTRTLVMFTLESVPEGTRLTVHESGFRALAADRQETAIKENTWGWEDCFKELTALIESGQSL